MVEFFRYSCGKCGYEVIASGKSPKGDLDEGMTLLCENCKELYEIEPESAYTIKKTSHRMLRCPQNFMHKIRVWTYPGPCPKCGEPMNKGEHVINWD